MVSADRGIPTSGWPRVLFAGGGTLGHIMPGLAVADEVRRRWPRSEVMFVTSANAHTARSVASVLARHRIRTALIAASRRQAGSLRRLPALTGGLFSGLKLVRRFRPDVVVGLGGYGSVATVLAADLLRVPTMLLEQNALPGRANRLLARWARLVCCAWPGADAFLPHPERARFTGNPVRRGVLASLSPEGAGPLRRPLGPGARKKTLLVLGGSNGAQPLNEMILACLPALEKERAWLRIIHSTGEAHYGAVRRAYDARWLEAMVAPFVQNMAAAYRMSDLVVCRAGGSTLAEVCAAGRAAIVIPFPYAADDHQRRNAQVLAGAGAALMLDQMETTPDALCSEMLRLLTDDARRRRMASRSLALGRPGAAGSVVAHIEDLSHPREPVGAASARS